MAKITPRYRHTLRAGRILGIGKVSGPKKVSSEVSIMRTGGDGAKSFEACVRIGTMKYDGRQIKRASHYTTSCMFGQNPRTALAAALARASRQMKKRSGAFARYR